MRRAILSASALACAAASAQAGAIERTTQSTAILFEEGRYVEFSFGRVSPDVSGEIAGTPYATGGKVLGGYNAFSLGFKMPLTPEIDIAVVLDQPVGADVSYPANALYPIAGTTATVDSVGLTLMARYKLPSQVSLIGGVRALRTSGEVNLPVATALGTIPYDMTTSTELDFGWLIGIAWEKPEIAARVSLTYNSRIKHNFSAVENTYGGRFDTVFETTIPESINLEFQTGIMADTLLFGSIRWVDWSEFSIDPPAYRSPANPANQSGDALVSYEEAITTYTLGLGRRFSDAWSGALFVGYEDRHSGPSSNLGPVNGHSMVGAALTYTTGPVEITAGLRYLMLQNTSTKTLGADFYDNHAVAAGLRIGYRF